MRFIFVFILGLLICTDSSAQTSEQVDSQQKLIESLEKSIREDENRLSKLRSSKTKTVTEVEQLSRQISKRNTLIRTIGTQITKLEKEISSQSDSLKTYMSRIDLLKNTEKELVRSAYRNYRHGNFLSLVFSSQTTLGMIERIAMIRSATLHRIQQINQIQDLKQSTSDQISRLTLKHNELEKRKIQLNNQKAKLSKDRNTLRESIKKLSTKEKNMLFNVEKQQKQLDHAIATLRKLTKGNKKGNTFSSRTRGLRLPVTGGKVIEYKGNMAIIQGIENSAVTTIYEGRVVDVKRNKINKKFDVYIAYGEYIASYANLSNVVVKKGDSVQRNQRIGTIGSSINSKTFAMEYRLIFGIYAPSASTKLDAAKFFN